MRVAQIRNVRACPLWVAALRELNSCFRRERATGPSFAVRPWRFTAGSLRQARHPLELQDQAQGDPSLINVHLTMVLDANPG
jgi:hypothetical protein